MKKFIAIILVLTVIFTVLFAGEHGSPLRVCAADEITVILNGEKLEFDVPPMLVNDRTMVPMRVVFEKLGCEVEWVEDMQWILAKKIPQAIWLTIGDLTMYIGIWEHDLSDEGEVLGPAFHVDKIVELDVAPMLVGNRTLVPLRAVSEAFGATVEWDNDTQTVTITTDVGDGVSDVPPENAPTPPPEPTPEPTVEPTVEPDDGRPGAVVPTPTVTPTPEPTPESTENTDISHIKISDVLIFDSSSQVFTEKEEKRIKINFWFEETLYSALCREVVNTASPGAEESRYVGDPVSELGLRRGSVFVMGQSIRGEITDIVYLAPVFGSKGEQDPEKTASSRYQRVFGRLYGDARNNMIKIGTTSEEAANYTYRIPATVYVYRCDMDRNLLQKIYVNDIFEDTKRDNYIFIGMNNGAANLVVWYLF